MKATELTYKEVKAPTGVEYFMAFMYTPENIGNEWFLINQGSDFRLVEKSIKQWKQNKGYENSVCKIFSIILPLKP